MVGIKERGRVGVYLMNGLESGDAGVHWRNRWHVQRRNPVRLRRYRDESCRHTLFARAAPQL